MNRDAAYVLKRLKEVQARAAGARNGSDSEWLAAKWGEVEDMAEKAIKAAQLIA